MLSETQNTTTEKRKIDNNDFRVHVDKRNEDFLTASVSKGNPTGAFEGSEHIVRCFTTHSNTFRIESFKNIMTHFVAD